MVDLIWFDRAREALQKASQVDEVKDIRDKAEALRLYTKQAGDGLQMQNYCAEIKIRAERRAGELLAQIVRSPGGRPEKNSGHAGQSFQAALSEVGIAVRTAHRYQTIASLPEQNFEAHIIETKSKGKEITSADVYRKARKLQPRKVEAPNPRAPPVDSIDAKGRTPYVQWITFLRQNTTLLEEINSLGGFDAIIKRLTPAQVDDVIAQVQSLDRHIRILVRDANRIGDVITIIQPQR